MLPTGCSACCYLRTGTRRLDTERTSALPDRPVAALQAAPTAIATCTHTVSLTMQHSGASYALSC